MDLKDTIIKQLSAPVKRKGIQTIGEIVQLSRDELRNIRGAGTAFIFEIENMLDEYGLSLNGGKS